MTDANAVLDATNSILLIDWPSREVPDSLAHAGLRVIAQEGQDMYVAYDLTGADVRRRADVGRPESVDLVYAYRPLDELPDIVRLAQELRARAIWLGAELSASEIGQARDVVEGAGMVCVGDRYIVDAIRAREVAAQRGVLARHGAG